jgi:hypothetical protein
VTVAEQNIGEIKVARHNVCNWCGLTAVFIAGSVPQKNPCEPPGLVALGALLLSVTHTVVAGACTADRRTMYKVENGAA